MTDARIRIEYESNIRDVRRETKKSVDDIRADWRNSQKFYESMEKAKLENAKKYARFRTEVEKRHLDNRLNRFRAFFRKQREIEREESRKAKDLLRSEFAAYKENERRKTREHREQVRRRRYRMRLAKREREQLLRDEFAAYREKERRETAEHRRQVNRRLNKMRLARRERLASLRADERAEKESMRRRTQIFNQAKSRLGSGNNALFAGATRIGGFMPNTIVGGAARSAVTGGFLGYGAAAPFGGAVASLSKMGGPVTGTIGAIGGAGLTAMGGLRGAQLGVTFSIAGQAFSVGARMFSRAVGTFTRIVTNMVSRLSRLAIIGTVGTVVGGVAASSQRQRALQGMSTVLGTETPGAIDLVNQITNKGSIYSRTSLIESVMRGGAFGFNLDQIRQLMPTALNTSALSGEPVQDSLQAFARAAFQGETERAEAFLLNLRENKLKEMFGDKYNLDSPTEKSQAVIEAILEQGKRFEGGEARISNSLPGALIRTRSRSVDAFAELGRGFEVGSGLVPALNRLSDTITSLIADGGFQAIGRVLGQFAGGAFNSILDALPRSKEDLRGFFTMEDEGTAISKIGDVVRTVLNLIGELWDRLRAIFESIVGPKGFVNQLALVWDNFQKEAVKPEYWLDRFNIVKEGVIDMIGQISREVDKVGGNLFENILGYSDPNLSTGERFVRWAPVGLFQGAGKVIASGIDAANSTLGQTASRNMIAGVTTMHQGGRVPGPDGKEVPALLQAGEIVIPRNMAKRMPKFHNGTVGQGGGTTLEQRIATTIADAIATPFSEMMASLTQTMRGFFQPIVNSVKYGGPGLGDNIFSGALGAFDQPASPEGPATTLKSHAPTKIAKVFEEEEKKKEEIRRRSQNAYASSGFGGGGGFQPSSRLAGMLGYASVLGGNPGMVMRSAIATANGYGGKPYNPYTGRVYEEGEFDGTAISTPTTWDSFNRSRMRGPQIEGRGFSYRPGRVGQVGTELFDSGDHPDRGRVAVNEAMFHPSYGQGPDRGDQVRAMIHDEQQSINAGTVETMRRGASIKFYGNVYINGGPDKGILSAQTVGI